MVITAATITAHKLPRAMRNKIFIHPRNCAVYCTDETGLVTATSGDWCKIRYLSETEITLRSREKSFARYYLLSHQIVKFCTEHENCANVQTIWYFKWMLWQMQFHPILKLSREVSRRISSYMTGVFHSICEWYCFALFYSGCLRNECGSMTPSPNRKTPSSSSTGEIWVYISVPTPPANPHPPAPKKLLKWQKA